MLMTFSTGLDANSLPVTTLRRTNKSHQTNQSYKRLSSPQVTVSNLSKLFPLGLVNSPHLLYLIQIDNKQLILPYFNAIGQQHKKPKTEEEEDQPVHKPMAAKNSNTTNL
jgi:hypothetical protein